MAFAAVPLALLVLSDVSSASVNSLAKFQSNLSVNWLLAPAVVVALAIQGSYRPARRSLRPNPLTDTKDIAFGVGMGCVGALTISVVLHGILGTRELSAAQVVTTMLLAIVMVAMARPCLRIFHRLGAPTRVVVVGGGPLSQQLVSYLRLLRGVDVVGVVSPDRERRPAHLGTLDELPALCDLLSVNRVVITPSLGGDQRTVEVLRSVQQRARIELVPAFHEVISWRSRMSDFFGLPIMEVATPTLSRLDRAAKRSLDLVVASLALLACAPLMVLIAVSIKISSPGPVFFRQVRIGRNRQPFTILKFRTMRLDGAVPRTAASHADFQTGDSGSLVDLRNKLAEQDRVHRAGRLLRKLGLDELPQLLNVLTGDMSLVGPRPFVLEESEELNGWPARRFEVRPGITGLWQVSGRNDLAPEDLQRLDYLYVATWSLWWDIKILLDTPRTMAKGFGAY